MRCIRSSGSEWWWLRGWKMSSVGFPQEHALRHTAGLGTYMYMTQSQLGDIVMEMVVDQMIDKTVYEEANKKAVWKSESVTNQPTYQFLMSKLGQLAALISIYRSLLLHSTSLAMQKMTLRNSHIDDKHPFWIFWRDQFPSKIEEQSELSQEWPDCVSSSGIYKILLTNDLLLLTTPQQPRQICSETQTLNRQL